MASNGNSQNAIQNELTRNGMADVLGKDTISSVMAEARTEANNQRTAFAEKQRVNFAN